MTDILMETSEQINEIAEAISAFQAKLPMMPKDCTVDFKDRNGRRVHYKYTNIDTILAVIRPIMGEFGLCILQSQEIIGGRFYVTTTVMHKSGQYVRSRMAIVEQPSDMKALGTVLTYGKRYGLSALLGIASDEDLDNAVNQQGAAIAVKVHEPEIPNIDQKELAMIKKALGDHIDITRSLLRNYEINSLEDLPQCFLDDALKGIEYLKQQKALQHKGA